jgi:hypothetical protein
MYKFNIQMFFLDFRKVKLRSEYASNIILKSLYLKKMGTPTIIFYKC